MNRSRVLCAMAAMGAALATSPVGVRVGGSYRASQELEAFVGTGYDSDAVPDETLEAGLVDMDKRISSSRSIHSPSARSMRSDARNQRSDFWLAARLWQATQRWQLS